MPFVRREPDAAPDVLGQTDSPEAAVFLASISNQIESLGAAPTG